MRYAALLVFGCSVGCSSAPDVPPDGSAAPDQSANSDLEFIFPDLFGGDTSVNLCGDYLPGCMVFSLGPDRGKPFPLMTDVPSDPSESNSGMARDPVTGYLEFGPLPPSYAALWLANATDWGRGTVTLFDAATRRETGRYFSVTCSSLPTGSSLACDGKSGCCALDDEPRWQARKNGLAEPAHEAVQLMANSPSRTAIDYENSLWIANRAPGGQASVTKIAFDHAGCVDRNHDGQFQSSSDINGDGVIETDCNGDGVPDDVAGVKAKPCTNNLAQEFYGLDDECVLFTVNVNTANIDARAIAAGWGAADFGPGDMWVATIDGALRRVDGTSGLVTDDRQLPMGCSPWGMISDEQDIGWAATLGAGPLCYFDMKSNQVGTTRLPERGIAAWGITWDGFDIWLGGLDGPTAFRYSPDRTGNFAALGQGLWTEITNAGARDGAVGAGHGIVADGNALNKTYVWLATDTGWLVELLDSTLPHAPMDQVIDGSDLLALSLSPYKDLVVDVDAEDGLWAISTSSSTAIRIQIDQVGVPNAPDLTSWPLGMNRCPAGDRCDLKGDAASDPGTDSYGTFASYRGGDDVNGFRASYDYVVRGCPVGTTAWSSLSWQSSGPLDTAVYARYRIGANPVPDQTWSGWSTVSPFSPLALNASGATGNYCQVELDLRTFDESKTPVLQDFDVAYRCN